MWNFLVVAPSQHIKIFLFWGISNFRFLSQRFTTCTHKPASTGFFYSCTKRENSPPTELHSAPPPRWWIGDACTTGWARWWPTRSQLENTAASCLHWLVSCLVPQCKVSDPRLLAYESSVQSTEPDTQLIFLFINFLLIFIFYH